MINTVLQRIGADLDKAFNWILAKPGFRTLHRIGDRFADHRVTALSAEIAFFAMLALFPALLAIAAAVGFLENFVGEEVALRVQEQVVDQLDAIFTDQASGGIDNVRAIFQESSSGIVTLAGLAAVWAVSRTMHSVMGALSIVYQVKEPRPWLETRALALVFSVISIFAVAAVLAMFVVGPLFGTSANIAERLGMETSFVTIWQYIRYPLAFVILGMFAAVVFHLAPNGRREWRWDLPGAAVTTVLWLLSSVGLRLYIELASAGNGIYAVLGGALIVLVWLYLLGLSLILGAEVNVAIIKRHEEGRLGWSLRSSSPLRGPQSFE